MIILLILVDLVLVDSRLDMTKLLNPNSSSSPTASPYLHI